MLASGESAPVIASNHPSFFFYASSAYDGQPDANARNLAAGLVVMKQDIVTAAWHAELGAMPESDPSAALAAAKAKWAGIEPELIELVRKQAGIPKVFEPLVLTEKIRALQPSAGELAELERRIHEGGRAQAADE